MVKKRRYYSAPLDPPAHVLYEVLKGLKSKANPDEIIKKIRQHEFGLPAEDEFMMILSWLGKCQLVHKLGQAQLPPASKDLYKVPDLFAVFNYKGSKNLRDLFPEPPNPEDVPSCDENGVLGIVPGIIGSYMALKTICVIIDKMENVNELQLINLLTGSQKILAF